MIVREGRKLIASGKINMLGSENPFSKIILGTKSDVTTPEMSAQNLNALKASFGNDFIIVENDGSKWTATLGTKSVDLEEGDVSLTPNMEDGLLESTVTIKLPGTLIQENNFPIRSLGLIYKDGNQDVLFSRLSLPQYILSANVGKLVFKYYLDF